MLVLRVDQILASKSRCWDLSVNENLVVCPDCKSIINYIKIEWGVVAEDNNYMVVGNRGKKTYQLREVGFIIYCAICGSFIENYGKWFYPEDRIIINLGMIDDLDAEERAEIEVCLSQFNQKGDFKARYDSPVFTELKKKLIDYEKKHPIKL